jgi:uncharacterized membrane protein (DUF2068 family)
MRSRPPTVTVAAILLVLLSLFDFPWLYQLLFPGAMRAIEPPAFIDYSGCVLGIVGIVVAIGLWRLNKWSFWATIVVCVLNFLSGAPAVVFGPGGALKAVIVVGEVVAVLIIVLVVLPSSRRALETAERPSRVR